MRTDVLRQVKRESNLNDRGQPGPRSYRLSAILPPDLSPRNPGSCHRTNAGYFNRTAFRKRPSFAPFSLSSLLCDHCLRQLAKAVLFPAFFTPASLNSTSRHSSGVTFLRAVIFLHSRTLANDRVPRVLSAAAYQHFPNLFGINLPFSRRCYPIFPTLPSSRVLKIPLVPLPVFATLSKQRQRFRDRKLSNSDVWKQRG